MSENTIILLNVLLSGILTSNYVLVKTTGICPFLGVSKKFQQAAGMGVAVIFVMLCATAATWPIYTYLLKVLGVTTDNISNGYNFTTSIVSALSYGIGFLLAMILFAGVRSRIENCPSPKSFKGIPITLVAAAIVALAFGGFSGLAQNLLGVQ